MSTHPPKSSSRREFLKNSTAATLAGTTAVGLATGGLATGIAGAFPRPAQDGVLRVGLVGCGGRGGSAATNALRADPNVQLVALGDTFEDRALATREQLRKVEDVSLRVQVDDDHVFTGFDAYKQVTDAVDVVLLATSPHFRPLHVAYAVEQGKHLFVEKPVATDAVGVRSIKESCQKAAEKNLTVVSGLCYRYQFAKKETVKRIQEGAVGDIRALRTTYNTGELWHRGRRDEWSEMEYQIRNWLYFTWLSGDHIAEQHIHSLDKLAWVMDGYPVKATSSGGRIKRTDPKYGNIYDHFNTVFEWENGVVGFSSCRQWSGCSSDVSDYVYGTKGVANIQRHTIEADGERWRYRGEGPDDMYQNEHDAMFKAIRAGEPINNGEYMCNSTMMAIMARMAAYTGQTITWEQAWNSALDLSPEAYAWGDAPQRPVAIPGLTKFV